MTTSINNINDYFSAHFENHKEFRAFLGEFDKDTRWEPVQATDVEFIPMNELSPADLSMGGVDAFNDTMDSGLPIAVALPDKRKLAVRTYLFKNIKQHHRDGGAILSDMLTAGAYSAFCQHLNLSKPFLHKKKILMMTRGEKISGWFSEFNANRSQTQQFDFFEGNMRAGFPELAFEEADVTHFFTSAVYRIGETMTSKEFGAGIGASVLGPYLDAWEAASLNAEVLMAAVPKCRFITGESGLTSIVLSPMVELPTGEVFYLGGSLSVNHRGEDKAVWDKFETFPSQVAVMYQKGLKGLANLCTRRVYHPYSCMTHLLNKFKASIPMEHIKAVAEDVEMFYPPMDDSMTCFAIDLYNNYLNPMVAAVSAKQNPLKSIQNIELVARIVTANWDEFDVPTPVKFSGKTKVVSDEVDWLAL